ncbi:MAG TPA: hypothetical protein PLO61_08855 [Fimbriimonadaceae bacterium]|nr:hypothetical protein [Fimbriimonadaceae bacterium]HRJ33694.1 hypothetical protein [Fimbriimonadaceae bacterium]
MRVQFPGGEVLLDHRKALVLPAERTLVVAVDPGVQAQQLLFEAERSLSDRIRELAEEWLVERIGILTCGSWGHIDLGPIPREVLVISDAEEVETPHPKLVRLEIGSWAIESMPGTNLTKPQIAPGGHQSESGRAVFVASEFTLWLPLFEGSNKFPLPSAPGLQIYECGAKNVEHLMPTP